MDSDPEPTLSFLWLQNNVFFPGAHQRGVLAEGQWDDGEQGGEGVKEDERGPKERGGDVAERGSSEVEIFYQLSFYLFSNFIVLTIL